jgi:hypothetical protein
MSPTFHRLRGVRRVRRQGFEGVFADIAPPVEVLDVVVRLVRAGVAQNPCPWLASPSIDEQENGPSCQPPRGD